MAEVIDLLSSSPPRAKGLPASTNPDSIPLSNDIFNFGSDDFNLISDLNFEITQSAKRRKLSPPSVALAMNTAANVFDDLIPNLSFESDIPQKTCDLKTVGVRAFDVDDLESDKEDVFHFSSSAPEPIQKVSIQEPLVVELSSGDEHTNDGPTEGSERKLHSSGRPVLSERTANLLAGLHTSKSDRSRKSSDKDRSGRSMSIDLPVSKVSRFRQFTKLPATTPKDDIVDSSQAGPVKQAATGTKQSNVSKQDKSAAKEAAKTEKEAEKERKRKEKEQKAIEKQKLADIAEVNKSKTNKKNSSSEMIVDMPEALRNLSVGNQVEEYMKELNVEVTFSREEEINFTGNIEVFFGNIIKWRRKVVADYDGDAEVWKPLPEPRVTQEKHILIYLKAEEFINLAVIGHSSIVTSASEVPESNLKSNLDNHVKLLRTRYPANTIIYLIEGLTAWNRKSQTVKNRAYTAAVRSQVLDKDSSATTAPPPPSSQARPRKQRKSARPQIDLSSITPDTTETLLLHLQLRHQPLLIHHTTSPATTASQISVFTQHLSTRPYRLAEQNHNLASASFCMTTGQIRTGATPHETYINMLQEINRVTPSMAYGISSAGYRSARALVEGFRKEGNLMLEDVRKSVNKDGGWSDRRLGPMVSKRLYRVFMGRDPAARDGIA